MSGKTKKNGKVLANNGRSKELVASVLEYLNVGIRSSLQQEDLHEYLCAIISMQLCNCLYAIVSMQLCNCVKMEGAYYCAESVIDMNKNAEIQLYTSVILVVSYQQVLSENC